MWRNITHRITQYTVECLPQSSCVAVAVRNFSSPKVRILFFIEHPDLLQLRRPQLIIGVSERALEPSLGCSCTRRAARQSASNHGVVFLLTRRRTVTVGQCQSSKAVITWLYSWTNSSTVWSSRAVRYISCQRYVSDKSEEIMIEMYKILTGKYDVDVTPKVLRVHDSTTRGNVQIKQRSSKV